MISTENMNFNVARMNNYGHREPLNRVAMSEGTIYDSTPLEKVRGKLEDGYSSKLTTDDYLVMTEYAKWLPDGKRTLALNLPRLRNSLIAEKLIKEPLTKTSGLNKGGFASSRGVKAITQLSFLQSIRNNNRIVTKEYPYTNPNYTSWRNNFSV